MTKIPADELRLARRLADKGAAAPATKYAAIPSEVFDAMEPRVKAVTVARDVLAWLDEGKLKATAGTYLSLYEADGGPIRTTDAPKVNGYECKACALGAVLACTVERDSKLALNSEALVTNGFAEGARELLDHEGVFSTWQLILMESAFECADFTQRAPTVDEREAVRRAIELGTSITKALTEAEFVLWNNLREKPEASKRRLRAIMQNVIDNDGTFVP